VASLRARRGALPSSQAHAIAFRKGRRRPGISVQLHARRQTLSPPTQTSALEHPTGLFSVEIMGSSRWQCRKIPVQRPRWARPDFDSTWGTSRTADGNGARGASPRKSASMISWSKGLGRAVPYGIYDLAANAGWVSVGIDHDTDASSSACPDPNRRRRWGAG